MKKGMRLLVLATAASFLLGGCGTPLYEMTDEEETLIVQSAAYLVSKHNIYQKDGMNNTAAKKAEEDTEQTQDTQTEGEQNTQNPNSASAGSGDNTASVQGPAISLAEAIGYKDALSVSYEGYSLMDVYREGTYFSLNAEDGNTFVVMEFTIKNPKDKKVSMDNFEAGYAFYLNFEGGSHVAEKKSFITNSLSTFEGTIPAKGESRAVLIFEITKEQAEQISAPTLTMEQAGEKYTVSL